MFRIRSALLPAVLVAVFVQGPLAAWAEPIPFGESHKMRSVALDEDRILNVLLPADYADSDTTYPLIFLLDGSANQDYLHVAGLVRFLETYALMPPSILVGIGNTDRQRDMTYPSADAEMREWAPTSGGSAAFRGFIAEEVLPWAAREFRASGETMLIGQSAAGLLATEVFVETPELFDRYVIVSPSLWWDNFSLLPRIADSLQEHGETEAELCLVIGTEGAGMEGPVHAFAAALAEHAPESLVWHHVPLPDETHATILHRGLYRAFELMFGEEYPGM